MRDDRILMWGLGENVEFLMAAGLRDPSAIADRLNSDPTVQGRTGKQVVLPKDIQNYFAVQNKRKQDALAKSLSHSDEGRALAEAAKADLLWLVERVEAFKLLQRDIEEGYRIQVERWKGKVDADKKDDPAYFPEDTRRNIEATVRLIKDLAQDYLGNEKVQMLLKAAQVNIHQGISHAEHTDAMNRMVAEMVCPNCSYKSFGPKEFMAAFARANAKRRVVDVEPTPAQA